MLVILDQNENKKEKRSSSLRKKTEVPDHPDLKTKWKTVKTQGKAEQLQVK